MVGTLGMETSRIIQFSLGRWAPTVSWTRLFHPQASYVPLLVSETHGQSWIGQFECKYFSICRPICFITSCPGKQGPIGTNVSREMILIAVILKIFLKSLWPIWLILGKILLVNRQCGLLARCWFLCYFCSWCFASDWFEQERSIWKRAISIVLYINSKVFISVACSLVFTSFFLQIVGQISPKLVPGWVLYS